MSDDLDLELRKALVRKEPSRSLMPRRQAFRRWAIAACLVTAALGGYEFHEQQRAKNQLVLALRLAGSKLEIAQKRVQSIGMGRVQ